MESRLVPATRDEASPLTRRRPLLLGGLLLVAGLLVLAVLLVILSSANAQTTSGDGWRLLASTKPVTVPATWSGFGSGEVAGNAASAATVWKAAEETDSLPSIDFTREVLLRATAYGPGACVLMLPWVTFRGLSFRGLSFEDRLIIAHASRGLVVGCTADARPYVFLIAMSRDRLPAPPFSIRVEADGLSGESVVESIP